MEHKDSISVVIPVYGCKSALPELYTRLIKTLSSITNHYEIVFVDDCCPQNSWEVISAICEKDRRVIGIKLARNFGQIRAITAGLDESSGDWVVVMDCDLQDKPEGIKCLYNKAVEGYDVVFARRIERKDKAIVKFLSRTFYRLYGFFTNGYFDNSIGNFSISKRIVIDNYCKLRERNRAFTLFIKWLGFDQGTVDIEADLRFEGKSSYRLRDKITMAFEIITSQSNKPLHFFIGIGLLISLFSFIFVIYIAIKSVLIQDVPVGWTSTVASIYLMGGLILMAIGIVGIYIGNIFDEVKGRPLYVAKEIKNKTEQLM